MWYTRLYIDLLNCRIFCFHRNGGTDGGWCIIWLLFCCFVIEFFVTVVSWICWILCGIAPVRVYIVNDVCNVSYSVFYVKMRIFRKIYWSLTRQTGCLNWNVGTFVPCAASANPGAHSRCYDHAKLCYAQRSNINAQTLIILCIQWPLDRPSYVAQLL